MNKQGSMVLVQARLLCVLLWLAASTHAHYTQQEDKRLENKDGQTSLVSESGGMAREVATAQRGVRAEDTNAHVQSDASFWAARGKRPESGVRHARSAKNDLVPWAPVDHDHQVLQRHDNQGGAGGMGNDGEAPGTTFWVSRGKKDLLDYLPFYWGSNQGMWGGTLPRSWATPVHTHQPQQQPSSPIRSSPSRSGWESNQSLWGKRDNRGPFWVARGKRQEDGPFWISRGKRPQLAPSPPTNAPLWAVRGRKSGDETFWIARGKKADTETSTAPFWIARGKKSEIESDNARFWIARGKKDDEEESSNAPFWIARGKKAEVTTAEAPFWVARGKKNDVTTVSTPYWIARGKKEDGTPPFWISRGKKETGGGKFWVARGKKEEEEQKHPFWIARGKRAGNYEEEEEDEEQDEEQENEELTTYIMESIMKAEHHNATQNHDKGHSPGEKETSTGEEHNNNHRHPFNNKALG